MNGYKSKAALAEHALSYSSEEYLGRGMIAGVEKFSALKWSCKMRASSDRCYRHFQWYMFLMVSLFLSYVLWVVWGSLPSSLEFFIWFSSIICASASLMVMAFRQKTVFNYVISDRVGECESYLNFPSWSGSVFKGVVIAALMILFGMAVAMGSFAPLLGAGALGLGYAGRLLGWKNEVSIELSEPWNEHAFLTLDYKRKIIVTHHSNMLYGFELRFPDQALFDECLAFLKTVLPDNIEVLVKDWDSHDARRLDS